MNLKKIIAAALPLMWIAVAAHAGAVGKTYRSFSTGAPQPQWAYGLMVKPKSFGGEKLYRALSEPDGETLSRMAGVHLSSARRMSGGASVVRFDTPITLDAARKVAARMLADGSVASAEPDRIMRPMATITPTDPSYPQQWHYMAPAVAAGGADLPGAWGTTTGSASVVVAVLDTGILPHEDISSSSLLPGYDFITNYSNPAQPRSNPDGANGRDSDPSDPGDYATSADFCYDAADPATARSSWHGMHVAGTIIAAMNNTVGGAGIAPGVRLLPLRVIGTCGALSSDIIDAMRWAVGLAVPNMPGTNPTPAKILNMSLGGDGACSPAYQDAVNDVIAHGASIFAASGNDNNIAVSEPANCKGVIAVTAHAIDADVTDYANIGPEIAISAPGGGCGDTNHRNGACDAANTGNNRYVFSTSNTGATAPDPAQDGYRFEAGTSMAVPHAAGVAALMLSVDGALSPAKVRSYLQQSARAFPSNSACLTVSTYAGNCGAGLLDAANALAIVAGGPPAVNVDKATMIVAPATPVVLSASEEAGRNPVVEMKWEQTSGDSTVTLTPGASATSASFTAPSTGKFGFRFYAKDSAGQVAATAVRVIVNSTPAPAAIGPQSVTVGGDLRFTLQANDADNDPVIFTPVSLPSGASLDAAGNFAWPKSGPIGDYVLKYAVSDPYSTSADATVTIHVVAASSGGGGGAADPFSLASLGLLAFAGLVRRRALQRQP